MERLVPYAHVTYLEGEGHVLLRQAGAIATFLSRATSAGEEQLEGRSQFEAEPPFPAAPLHSIAG